MRPNLFIRFVRTVNISVTNPALGETLSITGKMGGLITGGGLLGFLRRTVNLIRPILTVLLHVTDPGQTDTLAIGTFVLSLRITFLSGTTFLVTVISTITFKITLPMIWDTFASVTSIK